MKRTVQQIEEATRRVIGHGELVTSECRGLLDDMVALSGAPNDSQRQLVLNYPQKILSSQVQQSQDLVVSLLNQSTQSTSQLLQELEKEASNKTELQVLNAGLSDGTDETSQEFSHLASATK